ncbi:hypothetical protein [Actinoplanes sp. G11-F43]|uniref:hypothetical protein n=1 Tax=Actinoplanes sp. G11-F43 TaxID=3424130 RepID=UPI003D3538B9
MIAADPGRGLATVFEDQSRIRVFRLAAGADPVPAAEIPASWVAAATFDEVSGDLVVAEDNGGSESSLTVWSMTDPAAPRRAITDPAGPRRTITDPVVPLVPRRSATIATQGGIQTVEARGGLIVAGQRDIIVWDGQNVRSLPRRGRASVTVSLSADRTMLAVTGGSGTELWHLSTADPLLAAVLPGRAVSAAFSPRDPLLTVGDPRGVTVWDVSALQMTLRDPLSEGCLRQGGLTEPEWRTHLPTLPFHPACR